MKNEIELLKSEMLVYSSDTHKINFSPSNRPDTLIGRKAQGEHCTSYALFVEFVMTEINKEIKTSVNSAEIHVTEMVSKISLTVGEFKDLLSKFGLTESNDEKDAYQRFLSVFEEMNALKKIADAELTVIYEIKEKNLNLIAHYNHNLSKEEQEKNALCLSIPNCTIEFLNTQIKKIESTYFINLAVCLSNAYLKYQNKADYVTFRKVAKHEANSNQGSDVRDALNYLRQYIDSEPCVQTLEELDEECRKSLEKPKTRAAMKKLSDYEANPTEYVKKLSEDENDSLINDIVKSINDLLFYPKIKEQSLVEDNSDPCPTLVRTNNISVLKYVIVRHLKLIFKTFDGLTKSASMKKQICEKYINIIILEWEITGQDAKNFSSDVMSVLTDDVVQLENVATPLRDNIINKRLSVTKTLQGTSNIGDNPYIGSPVRTLLFTLDNTPDQSLAKPSNTEENKRWRGSEEEVDPYYYLNSSPS